MPRRQHLQVTGRNIHLNQNQNNEKCKFGNDRQTTCKRYHSQTPTLFDSRARGSLWYEQRLETKMVCEPSWPVWPNSSLKKHGHSPAHIFLAPHGQAHHSKPKPTSASTSSPAREHIILPPFNRHAQEALELSLWLSKLIPGKQALP